jgi:hypothetical protein
MVELLIFIRNTSGFEITLKSLQCSTRNTALLCLNLGHFRLLLDGFRHSLMVFDNIKGFRRFQIGVN